MLAVYGVDVLDPAVSLRRVHVLATRLPPGSLPAADHAGAWSTEAHLLARLNDAIDVLTWITLRVNGSKASKPKPMTRPGKARAADRRPKLAWGDLASALGNAGATSGG
jgi:hypothetical protein